MVHGGSLAHLSYFLCGHFSYQEGTKAFQDSSLVLHNLQFLLSPLPLSQSSCTVVELFISVAKM